MTGKLLETIDIPPASGKSFVVKQDQILRIIDIEGQQVGDFVCFNLHNLSDKFSAGRTRRNNNKLRVTKGDRLFSNLSSTMHARRCGGFQHAATEGTYLKSWGLHRYSGRNG